MWDGAMVKPSPGHRPWISPSRCESSVTSRTARRSAPNEPSWIHRRHRKKPPLFIKIILKSITKSQLSQKVFPGFDLKIFRIVSSISSRTMGQGPPGSPPVRELRSASTRYRSSASGSLLRSRQPGCSRTSWSTELSWSIRDTIRGPWLWLSYTIPSGKHTKSYWKWPFIVDLPIKQWWFSIAMLVYQRVAHWGYLGILRICLSLKINIHGT